jgi:hypothetical protein
MAALLISLLWGGGILYWHLHLRSVFRTFERTCAPGGSMSDLELNEAALETLSEAGCRSLPFFVEALDPSKPVQFLQTSTRFIDGYADHLSDTVITSADTEGERRRKCEQIRAWWRAHGQEQHQVWRFWTNSCRRRDPRELVD